MATASASTRTSPREPRGLTVADLLALVVGVAVVAGLPWSNWPEFVWRSGRVIWIANPAFWAIVAEVLGKACLAMVPVVLSRCAQFGRSTRPGEFLAACGGLYWLSWGIEMRLFVAWLNRQRGEVWTGHDYPAVEAIQWRRLIEWPKMLGLATLAVAALLVIVIGRRRLPAWIVAALAMLAWVGLLEGGLPPLRNRFSRIVLSPLDRAGHHVLAEGIGTFAAAFPMLLLYAWPSVVAVRGLSRDGRHWTWVQWAGVLLASGVFATDTLIRQLIDVHGILIGNSAALFGMDLGLTCLALILAIRVSVALSRRPDPPWSRSGGVGYDGSSPEPTPPEA